MRERALIALLLAGVVLISGCLGGHGGAKTPSSSQSWSPTGSTGSGHTTPTSSTPTSSSRAQTFTSSSWSAGETGERNVTVTFIVSVPYIPPNSSVYIEGDFNGWNPKDEGYRLKRLPDGRWAINLTFPYGTVINFKFTAGSGETVEKGPNGGDIPSRHFIFRRSGTYYFRVYGWGGAENRGHTITGDVRTFRMYIPQLNSTRRIWVYLPPDYKKSKKRYPVLYMFDGQNLFDQATSFAGEWGVDESLQRLYNESGFSIIVVGIDNGGDKRVDEYAPWVNRKYGRGGEGNETLKFIVELLKPYIDSQYRTLPNETGIMGSSLGGLMALYAGFKYPEVFRYVGAMSPALWFNPQIYSFINSSKAGPEKIYIDWGLREGEEMNKTCTEMVALLKGKGYTEGKNLMVVVDKNGGHSEYYWGRRFPKAVLWLFGG